MYVSQETPAQTEARLRQVLRQASLRYFDGPYYFRETAVADFTPDPAALAMVRDEDVWSYLVPAPTSATENFRIFSFHFPTGLDNSGFVGWLASRIKAALGSGVFVVCGQNSSRGGIFDYWGCPIAVADDVLAFVEELRKE